MLKEDWEWLKEKLLHGERVAPAEIARVEKSLETDHFFGEEIDFSQKK